MLTVLLTVLMAAIAGCAGAPAPDSAAPPAALVAIDRAVNARPYAALHAGAGWWDLPIGAVDCAGYAAWKYAELRLAGRPAVIVAWYLKDRGLWHAAVRTVDKAGRAWLLDSLAADGPSPRPWRPVAASWIEFDLAFQARKTHLRPVLAREETAR